MKDQIDFETKYWLSTEGYYFKYRPDRNNAELIRATLYNLKDEVVDDVAKSETTMSPEKTHHGIINYFEARISLGQIK